LWLEWPGAKGASISQSEQQNFANHSRFHPIYHFVLTPIFGVNFLIALVRLVRNPGLATGWDVVIAAALIGLLLIARTYALKVQDRVIRLEEQTRMLRLLPDDLRGRLSELSEGQLVAMRFCSDGQLEQLTRSVLDEKLQTRKEIKSRITTWRPDYFRV